MISNAKFRFIGLCLLALSLAACSLAPNYTRPNAPIPQGVGEAGFGNTPALPASAATAVQHLGWRDFFKDEQVKSLIATSLTNNRDVQLAALAIREAKAQYGVQNADRLPQVGAEGNNTINGGFQAPTKKTYEANLAVPSFELDLFGRLKSLSDASMHTYLASQEAAKAVKVTLVSQVAQGYLASRLTQERQQLAQSNLESWEKSFAFIEGRVRSGQSSLLELEQARSQVEFAKASVAQRQREVTQAENALHLLLGGFEKRQLPSGTSLADQRFADLPASIPSTVLLTRPDIMQAEHALQAANADIGAARAAFFPTISLTGTLGYMSEDLTRLFAGATSAWSFLPQVALPIFAGGKNKANLQLAEIRKESAVVQYEKAIQTAFREVADALMTRASFANQLDAQKKYLVSQRTVLELATQRYISGTISYLEVLDAQRGVFQAEQDLLDIRRDQLVNDIILYSALGGGLIDSAPALATTQQP